MPSRHITDRSFGEHDAVQPLEALRVLACERPPSAIQLGQMGELYPQEGGLKLVKAAVPACFVRMVFCRRTVRELVGGQRALDRLAATAGTRERSRSRRAEVVLYCK